MTRLSKDIVTLDSKGLYVNGAFRPLVAGQFEYWRHNAIHWKKILDLMRACGLEFVSTFVCWDFHEVSHGDFDFIGRTNPSRDLAGFVDASRDAGLQVFIRVGPIIDAEWPTRGPAPDVGTLERLHPHYLERTKQYLQALAPVLVPRLISNGGPVVLVGIDNESYFPYSTNLASDPSEGSIPVPYDEDLVTRLYRDWLRERYESSERLVKSWSRPGLGFESVTEPDYGKANLNETLDSFEFITASIKHSFELHKAMCREVGIDVPLYTNMKQFTHYIDWHEIDQVLDSQSLVFIQPPAWSLEQKLVASWYCRVQRSRVRLPWAPEHTTWAARFATFFGAALGLRGLCYYMFVERDDIRFGPISPIGKVRNHMGEFEDGIKVTKRLRPDRHLAEAGLLWSIDHHRCKVASEFDNWRQLYDMWSDYEKPKELGPWWDAFQQLHEADIDFDVVALADGNLEEYRVLIYSGPEFVRPAEIERLRGWVEKGGKLICTTNTPDRLISSDGLRYDSALSSITAMPNNIYRPWGRLATTIGDLGVRSAIRAGAPGLWTFAYVDEDGWSLFVVNVSGQAQRATVELGNLLLPEALGATVTDLHSDAEWKLQTESLWSEAPILQANEVRCMRVTRRKE